LALKKTILSRRDRAIRETPLQPLAFYHYHLENVSRSFSFCILQLVSQAKEWVALSYLLFRVADTIEDAIWSDDTHQYQSFQQFKLFLEIPPSELDFSIWLGSFPDQIPPSEKNLLTDLPLLLCDLQKLPVEIQKQIIKTLSKMVDGMQHFLKNYRRHGILRLPALETTNQYCFYVAGIVGELLSHIFIHVIPAFHWSENLLNQSFHFGLFLQKINILKDQAEDEATGRFFISSRKQLRGSLVINAYQALCYLKAIPIVAGRTYRLFCAWSLFIGLASLKWIDKNAAQDDDYKISTRETTWIMHQVKEIIDDNYALEALFKSYLPESEFETGHHSEAVFHTLGVI
jgi:phytoene/squalene synthetase